MDQLSLKLYNEIIYYEIYWFVISHSFLIEINKYEWLQASKTKLGNLISNTRIDR